MKTLAPRLSTTMTIIDVALCCYAVLKPFLYLAESTLLFLVNLVLGALIIIGYEENQSLLMRGC
jgi:hypothetical protein